MEALPFDTEKLQEICRHNDIAMVGVFGSVARGEATEQSDVDLLVDVGPNTSSWFPAGLILDLEELLGRRVEIVIERALNPHLREHVLAEAVEL